MLRGHLSQQEIIKSSIHQSAPSYISSISNNSNFQQFAMGSIPISWLEKLEEQCTSGIESRYSNGDADSL